MSERQFPIMRDPGEPGPHSVPWSFVAPHADAAQRNHGQSLERLADGGLDPYELLCLVRGVGLGQARHGRERELAVLIEAHEAGDPPIARALKMAASTLPNGDPRVTYTQRGLADMRLAIIYFLAELRPDASASSLLGELSRLPR